MKPLLTIWWRAFSIVSVTALNVVEISGGHYFTAFFTGGLLSFIWWTNARTAAHSNAAHGRYAYALGAACGTMVGMFVGRHYGR